MLDTGGDARNALYPRLLSLTLSASGELQALLWSGLTCQALEGVTSRAGRDLCDPFRVGVISMLDPGVARETRFTPGYYL
ncbi:MAG: hypothetical protein QOH70_1303 [Blastocatellia bacterium]|jgi:hypothetical protein|nr:hypothetical protein [Blastocatellia bacterium]